MALFDSFRSSPAPTGGFRFVQPMVQLMAGVQTWNDHRSTRKSLSKLTAHELNDIGLDHADVNVVADGRR
ncbi:DUF1127 domain-containing protein [Roseisalinus antarcticus]|uniref:YjiS-like domain-containing protein n=1 Tax=Roseisalinus antarcticus TaxID=254357 RepID=A0A1Y5T2Y2_9RHOB|nr:DUF1127 domain-containing protein [Roseisalinus antarcticus]SLN51080.1 hypothetical protein ROA7023_02231 [Roseisalinus antarcticus]